MYLITQHLGVFHTNKMCLHLYSMMLNVNYTCVDGYDQINLEKVHSVSLHNFISESCPNPSRGFYFRNNPNHHIFFSVIAQPFHRLLFHFRNSPTPSQTIILETAQTPHIPLFHEQPIPITQLYLRNIQIYSHYCTRTIALRNSLLGVLGLMHDTCISRYKL
ncbi:hypothetical protein CHS0354_038971 [Potamilus streckersoni]|uniref:Uncharacterized protein n=1 Tax=Potamilus streckersoni TaxID=2493646 RepID=A0AAE0S189_9BIVA|nr:hypothetical protein CHS0354_038971 [Potamilus streckersoni]